MLPFGPTTPAEACTLKKSVKERQRSKDHPTERDGVHRGRRKVRRMESLAG